MFDSITKTEKKTPLISQIKEDINNMSKGNVEKISGKSEQNTEKKEEKGKNQEDKVNI